MYAIVTKLKTNISNYVIDEYTSNRIYKKALQIIDDHNKCYSTPSDIKTSKSTSDKKLSNKEIIANLCKKSYSIRLKEIETRKLNDIDLRKMYRLKFKKIEKEILKIYNK